MICRGGSLLALAISNNNCVLTSGAVDLDLGCFGVVIGFANDSLYSLLCALEDMHFWAMLPYRFLFLPPKPLFQHLAPMSVTPAPIDDADAGPLSPKASHHRCVRRNVLCLPDPDSYGDKDAAFSSMTKTLHSFMRTTRQTGKSPRCSCTLPFLLLVFSVSWMLLSKYPGRIDLISCKPGSAF